MSSRYKVHDHQLPHFITCTVVGWVDAISREQYKEIICSSLIFCSQEKGLMLHAYVLMNNHMHLIVSARDGYLISDIIRDFKKYTSKRLVAAIEDNVQESRKKWMLELFRYAGANNNSNEVNQFWQQDYHPVALDSEEKARQRLNYLHENPVRAGIVWQAEDYKYSSAIDYFLNKPGIISIEKLF